MHLIHVERGDRRSVRAFLRLPFDIYRDIPQWVPPLMPGERARFRPDFAFYQHSDAAFFLVRDDAGQPVGRIAVLEHRPHNEYRNNRDALLYLYEAADDPQIAQMLFEAAEAWARDRGLTRLVGPKGFMAGDGLGLLVEGFEHRPAIGIPYNPPYYPQQWEEIGGMEKVVDYLSAFVDRSTFSIPERVRRIAQKIRQRRDFRVPTFRTTADLRAHAEKLKRAYNSAFPAVWSFTPIPDEDLDAIVDRLLLIADPPLMKLIFKGEDIIGFQFAYPDISAAIQRANGRIWPFGWLLMLLEKRRTEWINVNGNAVLPAYQGTGANAVLYDEMISTLLNSRYRCADLTQVQETNSPMLSDLAAIVPVNVYKRHRVYGRDLT
jgi:GNAT superfamily N-acetyltransferase